MTNQSITFPKVLGILNVTPDSFSDGGLYSNLDKAVNRGLELLEQGANIVDIGGESTRPGAKEVSEQEEIERVIPVIKEIKKQKPESVISIDTTKYEVAKQALDAGAEIINDISGLQFEPKLAELAAEYDASLVIMHIKGTPRSMQSNPEYKNVIEEVYKFLEENSNLAKSFGAKKIIIDVGIGFGKKLEHNFELLRNLEYFKQLGYPLLLGISRKSFMNQLLNIENPIERDLPTLIFHTLLINNNKNIDFIRVHNVSQIEMLKKIYNTLFTQS